MNILDVRPETTPARTEFYSRLKRSAISPLWESLADLVPVRPKPAAVAMCWSYDEIRPLLLEAGSVITTRESERRVLMLENPGIKGGGLIADSLYAGLQIVLPGEIARTHRHSASALRFVIEGRGAYTTVDGEQVFMQPGDFIVTPSWVYHDHGNPSSAAIVWMDGLDLPIVNLLNTGFAEPYNQDTQPVLRKATDSLRRYGSHMAPVSRASRTSTSSAAFFTYPYERSREALEWIAEHDPADVCDGFKMQYLNPATGGYPMPTIAAFLQKLPTGFAGVKYRSTETTIFSVVEGSGRSQVGDDVFHWKQHDIFVAPSWYPISHESETDSILFSFSDRPVQQALGLWREQCPIVD